jgi:hypothetical protein
MACPTYQPRLFDHRVIGPGLIVFNREKRCSGDLAGILALKTAFSGIKLQETDLGRERE